MFVFEREHLIDKYSLLEDIQMKQIIYGITVEEVIEEIKNVPEGEEGRYGDCWNCVDDSDCEDCEERENEIRGLKQEITELKKEV